jgi:hypothetical protein
MLLLFFDYHACYSRVLAFIKIASTIPFHLASSAIALGFIVKPVLNISGKND